MTPGCSRAMPSTEPRAARAARAHFRATAGRSRSTATPLRRSTIIESLEALAAPFGIGRGIHLGDTIIGTKGRVAFEAPAAEVLLTAHRELEKLVLTGRQQRIKELVAQPYGDLVHEGQLLDPVCRDIEALLLSSQDARHRRGAPAAAAPATCSSRASSRPTRSWRPRRACTARRRASGRRRMRSASPDRGAAGRVPSRARASAPRRTAAAAMVSSMRSVVVDKLASVTQACGLSHEVRVATDIPAEEGVVVVVEVLTNKSTYNTLELTSGRMAKVGKGDVVAGALGHRQALFGYSGHVPQRCSPATSSRCSTSAACSASATPSIPTRASRSTAGCSAWRSTSPTSASASACRRGSAQARSIPTRARHARRAGRGARRHLHGSRQDRGGLRDHHPHAPPRPHRRCVQGHRRLAAPGHPRDGRRRRAPLRDLHRPRHRHDHARERPGAHAHHADASSPPASPTCGVRARRRHPRHLWRRCHPRVPGHPRRAHRGDAVGERSGGGLGRGEAAARALRRSSRAW